ncbi:MAG TPA: 30S ribosomal protein S12 methylthiotransferase RimO [Candidatus Kapabacteria bacterium]|nr:30S ribosomal protein S12 methylthiotransferase RimO [Candidatus Kapabacteria bacterium]
MSEEIKKIAIFTLGCNKNLVDSERLAGILDGKQFELTYNINEAEAVIINTCGFIKPAKEESIQLILQMAELRRRNKIKKLIVFGCLSQRYPDLKNQILQIDKVFGIEPFKQIVDSFGKKYVSEYSRFLMTPPHYSYLKISEGCNHRCSFCAIPLIKGKYRSRKMEDLLIEAKDLSKQGVQELNIIAQDTTFYGKDIYGTYKLPVLLNNLAENFEFKWIRLLYTYPTNFPKDVLKVIAKHDNICKYIDLPLQHISNNVLHSMKRRSTKESITELIKEIRDTIPDVAIRTTFIVGYPNETEQDFEELYSFVEEQKFERLGVFTYSPEEGTSAYSLADPIPQEIKDERLDKIMRLQQQISLERNKSLIGNTIDVIIDDDENKKFYIGRTQFDAPEIDNGVIIKSSKKFLPGVIIKAKVVRAEEYDLHVEYPAN